MTLSRHQIRSILSQPLDDLAITIVDHRDPSLVNIKGSIESETRNTITIQLDSRTITVSKLAGRFKLFTDSACFVIDGILLEGKAKRRSKRKLRHW